MGNRLTDGTLLSVLGSVTDVAVMTRLRAPFRCEFIAPGPPSADRVAHSLRGGRWRIADANDDAIASCSYAEEGYARLIVKALNEFFARAGR